jgi:hypothetical protein
LEGLKISLEPYGDIIDLDIFYEPTNHTYMGNGYAVLNISATTIYPSLLITFLGVDLRKTAFMPSGTICQAIVAIVMKQDIMFGNVPNDVLAVLIGIVVLRVL